MIESTKPDRSWLGRTVADVSVETGLSFVDVLQLTVKREWKIYAVSDRSWHGLRREYFCVITEKLTYPYCRDTSGRDRFISKRDALYKDKQRMIDRETRFLEKFVENGCVFKDDTLGINLDDVFLIEENTGATLHTKCVPGSEEHGPVMVYPVDDKSKQIIEHELARRLGILERSEK